MSRFVAIVVQSHVILELWPNGRGLERPELVLEERVRRGDAPSDLASGNAGVLRGVGAGSATAVIR